MKCKYSRCARKRGNIPKRVHHTRILDHEILVLIDAMRQLTAVSGSEGEHLPVDAQVPVLQAAHVVHVVLIMWASEDIRVRYIQIYF